MIKNCLLLLILFSVFVCHAQTQRELVFEGYNLSVRSIAKDGKGNLLFATTILLKNVGKDSISEAGNYDTAILLLTDEKLNIKKSWRVYNYFPTAALYDKKHDVFWVGGSEMEYSRERPEQFQFWQLSLFRVDANNKTALQCPVETEYSCHMEYMLLNGDNLYCTAIKDNREIKNRVETVMAFQFSSTKFNKPKHRPTYKSPVLIHSSISETPPVRTTELTAAKWHQDGLYFAATASDGHVKTEALRLYQFRDGKLTSEEFDPDFRNKYMYFLTNFEVTKDGNYLFAYVTAPDKKFYVLEKTDKYMQTIWKIEVPDLQSPDFYNEVIQMPNGKIAAAVANKDKNWSYFIYDSDGKLLKEIDTKLTIDLQISATTAISETQFICTFSDRKKPMPTKILWLKTE